MIRTGIRAWLAAAGVAGAICLPVATSVPEAIPHRSYAALDYPIRIPLPASSSAATIAEEPSASNVPPDEATGVLLATASEPKRIDATLAPRQVAPPTAQGGPGGGILLNVAFDLGDDDAGADTVEVSKPVRANGVNLGQATIRLTANSTVWIARDQIVALLETAGQDDLVEIMAGAPGLDGFISFEEMRERGLKIRYDAVADHISLSS